MFTGLVEAQGTVVSIRPEAWGARLSVDAGGWQHVPALGDSISVNGVCLTVVERNAALHFDVVPQTLALTTLGALQPGEVVNLEHALAAGQLMGGHVVQGHVDGVGLVVGVDTSHGGWRTRVQAPATVTPYLVERGSIAVDGVSLTIAAAHHDWFEVALIPATLERTTLRLRLAGSRVNLEADCMARMVAEQVRRYLQANPRSGA